MKKRAEEEKQKRKKRKEKRKEKTKERHKKGKKAKAKRLEQRECRLQEKMQTTELNTNASTSGVSSLLGRQSLVSNNGRRGKTINVDGMEPSSSNENQCCVW